MNRRLLRLIAPALFAGLVPWTAFADEAAATPEGAARSTAGPVSAGSVKVLELDWEQLLSVDERGKFNGAPPAPVHDYLSGAGSGESGPAATQRVQGKVNAELDGMTVKLPGFIVPLDLDARNRVIEFFLVPYYGACIHVPPPPPNQIVFVKLEQGVELKSMYDAYWITGRMKVANTQTRLGASAYTIAGQKIEAYQY